MATVTGLKADRMLAIEAESIISGTVNVNGDLILTKHDGTTINAGHVKGTNGINGADATPMLGVTDTTTVDLTLSGAGTAASPWSLKADLINPAKLMQLAPNYIGPGPAYVTDIGTGLGAQYGPYEWEGTFEANGNPIVRLANRNGTYVITGHADGNSVGGWRAIPLSAGFAAYGTLVGGAFAPFSNAAPAVKTPAGIVVMEGLIRSTAAKASGSVIATLPPDMCPDSTMAFVNNQSDTVGEIWVYADGRVTTQTAMAAGQYISLSNIAFPAAGVPTWTPITSFLNGYTDYGTASFGVARYWVDPYGVCWHAGLVKVGTATNATKIFSIPTAITPVDSQHETVCGASNVFTGVRISGSVATGTASGSLDYLTGPTTNNWISLAGLTMLTPQAFTTLSFTDLVGSSLLGNAWAGNTGGIGGGNQQPFITKRPDGLVMTAGLLRTGTIASPAFYLEERMLPRGIILFQNMSNTARGRMDVSGLLNTSPTIRAVVPQEGSNAWFSMDGLKWYAGGI